VNFIWKEELLESRFLVLMVSYSISCYWYFVALCGRYGTVGDNDDFVVIECPAVLQFVYFVMTCQNVLVVNSATLSSSQSLIVTSHFSCFGLLKL